MAELENGKLVSLEELMVSTLAMIDALTKLLIEKGVITAAEFKQKLLEERAVYRNSFTGGKMANRIRNVLLSVLTLALLSGCAATVTSLSPSLQVVDLPPVGSIQKSGIG
jgi:hypothetical protein